MTDVKADPCCGNGYRLRPQEETCTNRESTARATFSLRRPWALDDLSRSVAKNALATCHIADADRASGTVDQKIDAFCQALPNAITARSAA